MHNKRFNGNHRLRSPMHYASRPTHYLPPAKTGYGEAMWLAVAAISVIMFCYMVFYV